MSLHVCCTPLVARFLTVQPHSLCPADQGFGVGHTRETETKGIWLWGTPVEKKEADGSSSMVRKTHQEKGGTVWAPPGTSVPVPAGLLLPVPTMACPRFSSHYSAVVSPQVLYVDTEGFESTGKANSYDDRIFALSALLSSLLVGVACLHACCMGLQPSKIAAKLRVQHGPSCLQIYNLPETIRESDVAKLSFAVDLAQGFYERDGDKAMVRGRGTNP